MPEIVLDGDSLTPWILYDIGHNPSIHVTVSTTALNRIQASRSVIQTVIDSQETVYAVNTGFGSFSSVRISDNQLCQLQLNLIRSHAAGVGKPMPIALTRMLLALRINVLAKGYSGISKENVLKLVNFLNLNCIPVVPSQGTVGASGDLAPLSHLVLGFLGEGEIWQTERGVGTKVPAMVALQKHGLAPMCLGPKEGLALINGTQLIVAYGTEAFVRAVNVARQADIVASLSLEALQGTLAAYHPQIHEARPHRGQIEVAHRQRSVLYPISDINRSHKNCGRVQDSYTLRCVPQVHGIVHDTLRFVDSILRTEMNSGTDNPMVFTDFLALDDNGKPVMKKSARMISGGNFHGEYPAKVLDYLAIAVSELGSISERRIEKMINPSLSNGLPAFLTTNGGLNSGFMIPHCTAAALVSENKVLVHPASTDSLSTSAAKEDHVSMGGFAARKSLDVVINVENILGIELFAACQAIHLLRPLKTTEALEKVVQLVRKGVKPVENDRYMAPDINYCSDLIRTNQVWSAIESHIPKSLLSSL